MTCSSRNGFTLIEVVGAALIFAVGVLMVLSLSSALGEQLERSAIASTVTVEVQEKVDSLATLPYSSLSVGSTQVDVTIRGVPYRRTVTVSQFSPLLRQITVVMGPTSGNGPSRSATTYVSNRW